MEHYDIIRYDFLWVSLVTDGHDCAEELNSAMETWRDGRDGNHV